MKNIVLIGFMGSGKSSVGRFFATHHRMKQIDTDQYIENREKRKISQIFETDGEEAFRRMETDTVKELLQTEKKDIILSVGGGLPMREENRALLKEFGTVIYLKASVDTLEHRLSFDKSRPLLQGGNLREKIETLMAKREQVYEDLADYVILTDGKGISTVEREIMLAMEGEE